MIQVKFKYANEKTGFIWQEVECTCTEILECIKTYSLDIDSEYVILDMDDNNIFENDLDNLYFERFLGVQVTTKDRYHFYKDESDTYYLFSYTGSDTNLVLPESINGNNYQINDYAFHKYTNITCITIPEGVTSIGEDAFSECFSLTSITIPKSITSIGEDAFDCCYYLVEIYNLSNLNIKIGSEKYGGIGLYAKVIHKDINEPSRIITTIDGYKFIKDDKDIYYLFNYLGSDTILTLPEGINGNNYQINKFTFFKYRSLTSITIPKGVTSIGESAFCDCTNLIAIKIAETLISIGEEAFSECLSLTSITIPESVKTIGDYAFSGCFNLTSITIPKNVTDIGFRAFFDCNKLVEIYNLSSLNIKIRSENYGQIGYYAKVIHKDINEPSRIITNKDGYQFIKDDKDIYYLFNYIGSDTILTLPENINGNNYQISDNTFSECTSLTSLTIPESVTNIGEYAFFNCSSLTSITIPNGITSINAGAFSLCSGLTDITIPDSVTSIEDSAFSGCSSLKNIKIPENVTSIGENAFDECISLTKITIPEKVITIGDYAFSECFNLTSVTIPESVIDIGESAFEECYKLVEIYNLSKLNIKIGSYRYGHIGRYAKVIHKDIKKPSRIITTEDGYQFIKVSKDKYYLFNYIGTNIDLILPESINGNNYQVNDYAFSKCSDLSSIIIPESITSMGNYIFNEWYDLTIYCEAKSKPSTWSNSWNPYNYPVIWDYKNIN